MNENERAATERQRLVLVHDAESSVRNLATSEGFVPPRANDDKDAPIDLTDLEAARFPALTPVASSTDGHRTAAYATPGAVELPPAAIAPPPPDSSIVVEAAVLDEPPAPDLSRLAPTVRRPARDPRRDLETTPDEQRLFSAQRRSRWLVPIGCLLVGFVLFVVIATSARPHHDIGESQITAQMPPIGSKPSLTVATIPSALPEVSNVEPASEPTAATPKHVSSSPSRTIVGAATKAMPTTSAAATVDKSPPSSHATQRSFFE